MAKWVYGGHTQVGKGKSHTIRQTRTRSQVHSQAIYSGTIWQVTAQKNQIAVLGNNVVTMVA